MGGASAVVVLKMSAQSMTPTPTVAEIFVMVLLGLGDDWAAIWKLPAMVGVVEVWIHG